MSNSAATSDQAVSVNGHSQHKLGRPSVYDQFSDKQRDEFKRRVLNGWSPQRLKNAYKMSWTIAKRHHDRIKAEATAEAGPSEISIDEIPKTMLASIAAAPSSSSVKATRPHYVVPPMTLVLPHRNARALYHFLQASKERPDINNEVVEILDAMTPLF